MHIYVITKPGERAYTDRGSGATIKYAFVHVLGKDDHTARELRCSAELQQYIDKLSIDQFLTITQFDSFHDKAGMPVISITAKSRVSTFIRIFTIYTIKLSICVL